MGNFNQEINKPYIDDDIDIMPYIRHIFKNKMTFFKGDSFSFIFSYYFNFNITETI